MRDAARQWLFRLLDAENLPASSVPKAAKFDIKNVQDAGFIQWQKSGAGAKYSIIERESVENLLASTGYHGSGQHLTPKARAVATHGDAHKGRDSSLLLTLSTASTSVWTNGEHTLNVKDLVNRFGIASVIVRPGDLWRTEKPIALVENLDLTIHGTSYFQRIGFDGSVLYYSGWLSKQLLDWLSERPRAPSFTVFPDYDIVGLKNYLIAKERLCEPVSLYVPANFEDLLKRFGNPDKLLSQSDRKVIESSQDPAAINVYRALLDAGKGLDQECLLFA